MTRRNSASDAIRVERLDGTSRESMGVVAFETWRFLPDGRKNPDFVLNQPRYRDAPIRLDPAAICRLAAAAGSVTVDLAAQAISAGNDRVGFEIEAMRRAALLEGLDGIGLTLQHAAAIVR